MLLIIRGKATKEQIRKMASDLEGYIKVVVDVEREILTGGGKRHVEGEQRLLDDGSKQENLWGGGLDVETGEIDYNSMINVRPRQQNFSRDIMSQETRVRLDAIARKLLL